VGLKPTGFMCNNNKKIKNKKFNMKIEPIPGNMLTINVNRRERERERERGGLRQSRVDTEKSDNRIDLREREYHRDTVG